MEDDDQQTGVPEWVVTYGDMMSLLLTFFIMLVSLSELKTNEGQIRAMMDAIREAFGPTRGLFGSPGRSTQLNSLLNRLSSRGVRSEGGLQRASRTSAGASGAEKPVERINHGTVVTLGGPTMFAPFDSALTEDLKKNLDILADVLRDKSNRIMVRGHASPEPLPNDPPFVGRLERLLPRTGASAFDHYDLSFARAHAAAEYLISRGIARRRLIISAAGDSEPRMPTRHAGRRMVNRRVDVFVIDSYITSPQLGPAAGR